MNRIFARICVFRRWMWQDVVSWQWQWRCMRGREVQRVREWVWNAAPATNVLFKNIRENKSHIRNLCEKKRQKKLCEHNIFSLANENVLLVLYFYHPLFPFWIVGPFQCVFFLAFIHSVLTISFVILFISLSFVILLFTFACHSSFQIRSRITKSQVK